MKHLIFAIGLLLLNSCKKDKVLGPRTIPFSLFFIVKVSGNRLDDTTLDNMKLFYFKNSIKSYVTDFIRASEEGRVLGVQTSLSIGDLSGDDNIKDFYLEYPDGDIDTLFVDYRRVNTQQAVNEPCYCYYPLREVKFNGSIAYPDPGILVQTVYEFNK